MIEAITNGLCDINDVKVALGLGLDDSQDDFRLLLAIDSASRLIEQECGRRFYQDTVVSPRRYVATDALEVEVDDISTTTGLIVQTDYAGTGDFLTTWDSSLYQLEPVNGLNPSGQYWPFTKIRAIRSLYFPIYGAATLPQPYVQTLVQVTAKWGWASIPTPIQQAAVVQAISIYKSPDAPFGSTGMAEVGIVRLKQALHPTAAMLIRDYSKSEIFCL